MIKVLEEAIERLRELPEEQQRYVARLIEEMTDEASPIYVLDDDERRLVREGLDDLDAGRVVSEADMKAFWNRNRK